MSLWTAVAQRRKAILDDANQSLILLAACSGPPPSAARISIQEPAPPTT